MRIKWRKFEGGYEVMLYLGDTRMLIVPQERWSVSTFYGLVRGSGMMLVPIKEEI
jgi:hypothetical protein